MTIRIGDQFSWHGGTFTRLPDTPTPNWPGEFYVLHAHPDAASGFPGQTFEAGSTWFFARGLDVEVSAYVKG